MKFLSCLVLVMTCVVLAVDAAADDGDWQIKTDLQGLYGPYIDSEERDQLSNLGLFLHADYLERGGLTLGYNRTMIGLKAADADIDQDQLFLSGRVSLTPDWAGGRIGLRFDAHWVDNNDDLNGTGDLKIVAPQISYTGLDEKFYFDLGYARSSYGEADALVGDLELDQFTPTLGFGFNERSDWLQFRGYLINVSNPSRAQGKSDTSAIEVKWTHWFEGRGPLGLEKFIATGLAGERLFAVDPDSAVVYNLADIQKASASVAGQWRLNDSNRLLLQFGYEGYTNELIADDYNSLYVYLDFTHLWD